MGQNQPTTGAMLGTVKKSANRRFERRIAKALKGSRHANQLRTGN